MALFFPFCDFTERLDRDILDAQKNISLQNYAKAIDQFEIILTKNPAPEVRIKIYYQLGELYFVQTKNMNKALEYFEQVISNTDNPVWLTKVEDKIGEIYFSYLHDYKMAVQTYEKLMKFNPPLKKQDFYQFRLGESYFNDGQFEKAIREFSDMSRNPKHEYYAQAFNYMAKVYFAQKKWDDAINYWKEYVAREDNKEKVAEAKFLIANAYETMDELTKAYELYYSIASDYPNPDIIHNRLKAIYDRRAVRKR